MLYSFSRRFRVACLWLVLCCAPENLLAELKGTWSDGDPEHTLTHSHLLGGATLLENGQVIAAGGLNFKMLSLEADRTAELYDPVARRWKPTGPLQTPRWSLDAITLKDGKALFVGGASAFAANAALDTAEVFDPKTQLFTATANRLSAARQSFAITRLNDGKILITGGNSTGNNLNGSGVTNVDLYDPETNSFQTVAALHAGRALHAQVTLADGRVVVIGGAQQDAEIYDPQSNRWTRSLGRLPTTLKDMKAFEVYDGRVFIAGGQNTLDGLTTDATWFFNPATGEFQEGPSMAGFNYADAGVQVGSSDYSAFDLFPTGHQLHGRFLLFAGGEHDPPSGPDVELHSSAIFDVIRNRFVNMGPMPHTHDDHTESLLRVTETGNPEVLLFGGNRSQGTSRFEFDITSIPKEETEAK